MKHDEPSMQASNEATGLRDQIEGGTVAIGRTARLRMGGHDDGFDHGLSALRGRQAEKGGIHIQRELTGDSSAEHLLEPVQKTFQKDWVKWQCSVDHQTQPILCLIIKAMKARGAKELFGQAPAGGNVRELQQMLDDL